jgi:Zn-finger nucleic acid-binding protein
VWLDRGELDKILERESGLVGDERRSSYRGEDYDDRRREDRYDNYEYKRRKRKGFLGDLFDFD